MNIGIVGLGIVGNALYQVLRKKHSNIKRYDPIKEYHDSLSDSDVIFICLNDKNIDMNLTRETVKKVIEENKKAMIVLRTTILPGTTDSLILEHKRVIVYMPEFLREWNVAEDTVHPDKIVFGTDNNEAFKILMDLFGFDKGMILTDNIIRVKPIEAEIAKLALNSLALIKVVFAEELYDLSKAFSADYENIYKIFRLDQNVNERHLKVREGGYRGADGKCLPKDTNFLIQIGKTRSRQSLLETAQMLNNLFLRTKIYRQDGDIE